MCIYIHDIGYLLHYSLLRDYGPNWFDERLISCLPYPLDERDKACLKLIPWYPRADNCDLYLVSKWELFTYKQYINGKL